MCMCFHAVVSVHALEKSIYDTGPTPELTLTNLWYGDDMNLICF